MIGCFDGFDPASGPRRECLQFFAGTSRENVEGFEHLGKEEKANIATILTDTMEGMPATIGKNRSVF